MQQVPTLAALHNLQALLMMKRDSTAKDAVRAELEKALQLAPEFEIAKANLKNLNASAADPGTPLGKP